MGRRLVFWVISLWGILILSIGDIEAIMKKVSIEDLTRLSESIVVGEVQGMHSEFADRISKGIVTVVTIRVHRWLKGLGEGSSVSVRFPGGVMGNRGLWVEDTPQFFIGEECVVFIRKDIKGYLTVTGWHQGKFPIIDNRLNVDGKEITLNNFISAIQTFINGGERGKIDFNFESPKKLGKSSAVQGVMAAPVISSISPTSGPAIRPYAINPNDPFNPGDRGTLLHIEGSGFGSIKGAVRFYQDTSTPVDAEDILSWSDEYISCKVPGRQYDLVQGKFFHASSGLMYVIAKGGTSNGVQFDVTFAIPSKRFDTLPITYYINENGTPDCDGEFAAVQAAFQTWEDVTFSNLDYSYGGTTSRIPDPDSADNYTITIASG